MAERDYKAEYKNYHGNSEQRENRSNRNIARRKIGLKVGDPKEVDHIIALSKGGSNTNSNLRAVSFETNRKKAADEAELQKKADAIEEEIRNNWKKKS